MTDTDADKKPRKRENLVLNLVLNIALPTLILTKFSGDRWLGPGWGLALALVCPTGYFVYDYAVRRRANFVSVIGMASVVATGSLGLLKAGGIWFAVKEAAVPLVVGLGVMFSTGGRRPLVRELLFNDELIDTERVSARLRQRGTVEAFERLLRSSSLLLATGFLISAVANFFLVRAILRAAPGTEAFNAELGRIHLLSWPVVVVPTLVVCVFALWRMLHGAARLAGLTVEALMRPASAAEGVQAAGEETAEEEAREQVRD